jgi:hypothetical protein
MKNILVISFMSAGIWLSACRGEQNKNAKNASEIKKTINTDTVAIDKNIKEIKPTFNDIKPGVTAALNEIIKDYLEIKSALANNDESDAKDKGKELFDALSNFDKSLLTAEQKKVYESEEDELKEDAEHIGKSKLEHQREHFSMMSESIYAIVKAFGSSQQLYNIYCANAENGEGAMWLSETADYKNPYMGNAKDTCFAIQERIR